MSPLIYSTLSYIFFLYILVTLVSVGFGEFLISFFIVLIKCSLSGPYFTLFVRSYFISNDG